MSPHVIPGANIPLALHMGTDGGPHPLTTILKENIIPAVTFLKKSQAIGKSLVVILWSLDVRPFFGCKTVSMVNVVPIFSLISVVFCLYFFCFSHLPFLFIPIVILL
jgi:hypothetical protein